MVSAKALTKPLTCFCIFLLSNRSSTSTSSKKCMKLWKHSACLSRARKPSTSVNIADEAPLIVFFARINPCFSIFFLTSTVVLVSEAEWSSSSDRDSSTSTLVVSFLLLVSCFRSTPCNLSANFLSSDDRLHTGSRPSSIGFNIR